MCCDPLGLGWGHNFGVKSFHRIKIGGKSKQLNKNRVMVTRVNDVAHGPLGFIVVDCLIVSFVTVRDRMLMFTHCLFNTFVLVSSCRLHVVF